MLKLADSFILSQKIQIVFETASELPLEPDSSNALSFHRPPRPGLTLCNSLGPGYGIPRAV